MKIAVGEHKDASYDEHKQDSYLGDEKSYNGGHEEIASYGENHKGNEEISYGGYEQYSHGDAEESEKYSTGENSYDHHGSAEPESHGDEGGKYDYHAHPSYKFEYGVKDEKTGDEKSHWEHRDGDVVKGQYTLNDADGTKRVVSYSSDHKNGFKADVHNIGKANHPPAQEKKEESHEYYH